MSIRRVAISTRVVEASNYVERRDAIAHDWYAWFRSVYPATALIPVPNDPGGVENWLESVGPDAIILSSGNDWGEYAARDETESALIEFASEAGLPLLGVCRGLHALNVYMGGGVFEVLRSRSGSVEHVARTHTVYLDPVWAELASVPAEIVVNSYHNQGVLLEGLAKKLRAFGTSADGVVEALHHPTKPMIGIQWHPERGSPSGRLDSYLITQLFECGVFWT